MRKPHSRIDFCNKTASRDEQPMLNRRRTLRYDSGPLDSYRLGEGTLEDWAWNPAEEDDLGLDASEGERDMDVTGAGAVGAASSVRPTQLSGAASVDSVRPSGLAAPQDDVQISSAARALGEVDAASPLHEARLAAIRAAIADGSYETPGKLEAAVDRLLAELGRQVD